MSTHSHIRVWVALILSFYFLTPFWRTEKAMDVYVAQEMQMTRETFGVKVTDLLISNAAVVFKFMPTGILESHKIVGDGLKRTKEIVPGPGYALVLAYNRYIEGLIQLTYIAILRFWILLVWMVVLGPVFVASVVDGFAQRAIKRAEFGAIRPAAYTLTSFIVIPLAMAPMLYLVLPISINPLITPMWSLVMALPLALMVSNMQPIFGRN